MSKKMLIDAAQAEEVRVCVTENGKVEDFDFESSARKPLRGNIYLARVTRVEPSLQAAFVEYGGNRHGFLAFNEIHPDYYQIPVSDRQLLQEAEAEEAALAAELDVVQRGDEDEEDDRGADFDGDDQTAFADDDAAGENEDESAEDREDADDNPTESFQAPHSDDDSTVVLDDDAAEAESDDDDARTVAMAASPFPSVSTLSDDVADEEEAAADNNDGDDTGRTDANAAQSLEEDNDVAAAAFYDDDADAEDDSDDVVGDSVDGASDEDEDDDDESGGDDKKSKRAYRQQLIERYKEARRKRAKLIRNYKIQEVVKRRQILLVQVVKEERGNKGAALTTYLSLAGRYCVLMPNTARGGGISRKIPNASDRKRLRRVVDSLDVAQGMGLIIRTAGAKRTKTEIKRDYDYLTRLWETIRSQTLESIAPCLIYEEASLIKRAIRDLYDKGISTVLVEGEDGYREAKDFMKMLMPSHAKNVQPYKDKLPLFVRYDVEKQLDAM
ncbi:MAG: ribonuclease E/G, partial [Pseudomonadota bacterium]